MLVLGGVQESVFSWWVQDMLIPGPTKEDSDSWPHQEKLWIPAHFLVGPGITVCLGGSRNQCFLGGSRIH